MIIYNDKFFLEIDNNGSQFICSICHPDIEYKYKFKANSMDEASTKFLSFVDGVGSARHIYEEMGLM